MRIALLLIVLLLCGCAREASPEVSYSAVLAAIESTEADIQKTVDLNMRASDAITSEGHELLKAGTPEKAAGTDKDMIRIYTETTQWLKDHREKKNKLLQRKAELEKQMGL